MPCSRSLPRAACGSGVDSAYSRAFARPRVECSSSRVAPAPRGSTGTPNSAAVVSTAATSRGKTTPIGSIVYMLASREKRYRV